MPYASAVSAASSATGMSLVPPVATTIFPIPSLGGISPIMPIFDNLSYLKSYFLPTYSAAFFFILVIRIVFSCSLSISSTIAAICFLVLLLPYMTSDIPCLNSRDVSTFAKPRSVYDLRRILFAASSGDISPEATFSNKCVNSSLFIEYHLILI